MILPTINPWLLIAAVSAILASFFGGVSAGKKMERSDWLEREAQYQQQVQKETDRANEVATIYGLSLNQSNDKAANLRRQLNEQREQLASCLPGGGVRFTPAFAGLYNDALQSNAADSGKPSGEAAGTDAATVLDTHIENGKRWKNCRDQLNSLIDILEPAK
jgi:hypothetical protein